MKPARFSLWLLACGLVYLLHEVLYYVAIASFYLGCVYVLGRTLEEAYKDH